MSSSDLYQDKRGFFLTSGTIRWPVIEEINMGKLGPLYCTGENAGPDEKKLNFQIVICLRSCIIV